MKLLSFDQYFKNSLKDPEFKKIWENSQPEYQISRQIIKKRLEKKLSQQDLAKKTQTSQAAICRLESMTGNPSLNLLKRLASALDCQLQISLK